MHHQQIKKDMNWGKKLVMALIAFMSFIVFLSSKMIMSNNDDLIAKNYYEDGLNYDQEYNDKKAAIVDSLVPDFIINEKAVLISFPCKVAYQLTSKCLANAEQDKVFNGTTNSSNTIVIPSEQLHKGEWQFNLKYSANNKDYFVKKSIQL